MYMKIGRSSEKRNSRKGHWMMPGSCWFLGAFIPASRFNVLIFSRNPNVLTWPFVICIRCKANCHVPQGKKKSGKVLVTSNTTHPNAGGAHIHFLAKAAKVIHIRFVCFCFFYT